MRKSIIFCIGFLILLLIIGYRVYWIRCEGNIQSISKTCVEVGGICNPTQYKIIGSRCIIEGSDFPYKVYRTADCEICCAGTCFQEGGYCTNEPCPSNYESRGVCPEGKKCCIPPPPPDYNQ